MDLFTHRPLSFHSSTSLNHLPFVPGYGHLRLSRLPLSYALLDFKAVLADRPTAPPEPKFVSLPASNDDHEMKPGPALTQIASLVEKQVAWSDGAEAMIMSGETRFPLRALQKKKAAENEMGREDTELESTWVHRLWVATGSSAMVGVMGRAIEAAGSAREVGGVIVWAMAAYVVADLATGIYHWGIDNYGDAKTPLFGSQIDAFQGHHKRPWTITHRQFANNIHALARPATFALAPFLLLHHHAYVDSFLSVFLACVVYSQQFHAWAHARKKDVPQLVVALQDMGLLVSRQMHGAHHRPPYNVNYCIVSGLWNPLLDRVGFFATLEKFIFATFHVSPRSWGETSVDWLQDGSYFSDATDAEHTSSP